MIRFSIHLPPKYRLDLSLVKSRESLDEEPLLPSLGKVFRSRTGSKFSRFFRLIFEKNHFKKILGTNLAIMVFASTLIPTTTVQSKEIEENEIGSPLILSTQNGIHYPVKNIKITQGYKFYHPGIDLDGATGDEVKPITRGVIEIVEYSKLGYGNSVLINHGNEVKSLYAHLSKIEVSVGESVTKDTKIGEMGATGWAKGDHLHLEIHESGKSINPLTILPREVLP